MVWKIYNLESKADFEYWFDTNHWEKCDHSGARFDLYTSRFIKWFYSEI